MNIAITSALQLIQVSGPDAKKLLQGQLTCDINQAQTSSLLLGAHCNVKGRIESLFEIFRLADDYYLLIPTSIIDHAYTTLQKYAVLFKKAQLNRVSLQDILLPIELPPTFNAWRKQRIQQGLPTLFPETIGKFLPHDLNLPALNGVSFTKGCYLGQEIVARMQYIGTPKYHMEKIVLQHNQEPGTELENGTIIVDCIDSEALAVTRIIQT